MTLKYHTQGLICLILSVTLFAACQSPKNKTLEQLQGVWYIDCDSIRSEDDLRGFEFVKDKVYELYNCEATTTYARIHQDTMIYRGRFESRYDTVLIRKLTNSALWLEKHRRIRKYHHSLLERDSTLKFLSIEVRLLIDHDKPFIMIRIDSMGNVIASQMINKRWIRKRYRLMEAEKQQIDSAFQQSCIEKFQRLDWREGYDGWPKSMIIRYKNKSVVIQTKDLMFPQRLNPLCHFLFKSAHLRKVFVQGKS
jgi:hypothetical protein